MIDKFLDTLVDLATTSGFAGFIADGGWKSLIYIYVSGYFKGF